jgi:hypothetical protein
MSEGHGPESHGASSEVPVSQGIAGSMWIFLVFALLLILMQGGFVIGSAGMGHVWPAADSVKVPLPPMK